MVLNEIKENLAAYGGASMMITSYADNILGFNGMLDYDCTMEICIIADDTFYNGMTVDEIMSSKRISYIDYTIRGAKGNVIESEKHSLNDDISLN